MTYCSNCGNELNNQGTCPKCGFQDNHYYNREILDDRGGIGYFLLGACIPIVGLVLYLVWHNEKPKSAIAAGLGALIVFPMIIVTGIVAAFAIPAVGTIIDNTQKDAILADALGVENGAIIYCDYNICTDTQELAWIQIAPHVEDLNTRNYKMGTQPGMVVATMVNGKWQVRLEVVGTGEWEFTEGLVPSDCDRNNVIIDID